MSGEEGLEREGGIGPPRIGALMRIPGESLQRRLLDELHAGGFRDLVSAHLSVLRYPGPDGQRPSELALRTGMTRQAMNYLLGQLERSGYLTRTSNTEDQRSRQVHLTKRGHDALEAIQETMTVIEAELEQEMGRTQMAQLRTLLQKLNTTSVVQRSYATADARLARTRH